MATETELKLIHAASQADFARIDELVKRGVDVNGRLDNGTTALLAAALAGHIKIVQFLLEASAPTRTCGIAMIHPC